MNPSLYPEPTSQPTTHHRKRYIIITLIVLVIAGALYAWYALSSQGPTCLTRGDYQTLSGEIFPDDAPLAPSIDFYGFEIPFSENGTTYVDPATTSQIHTLGEFVTQHPQTSVIVTLQAMYRDDAAANMSNLMAQRIRAVTDSLTSAGIPSTAIKTDVRAYTPDPYDDALDSDNVVSLAITSSDVCR